MSVITREIEKVPDQLLSPANIGAYLLGRCASEGYEPPFKRVTITAEQLSCISVATDGLRNFMLTLDELGYMDFSVWLNKSTD